MRDIGRGGNAPSVMLTVLMSAIVMTGLLPPSAATASAPAWTVQPTANKASGSGGHLNDVSCVSATFCVAVGTMSYFGLPGPTDQSLVEMWNGSAWRASPAPVVGGGGDVLNAVSCT